MKICYVFLAEGFEEIEALTVVDLLRRARLKVETVSIAGTDMVTGSHAISVKADTKIEDVNLRQAGMLVLPGGMPGTKNLAECAELIEMLREFDETNRRISAICAAPSILGELGLLKNKKAVCYPGNEEKLLGAEVLKEEVVTDGNITTSRGMGTAIPFGLELIKLIVSETEAGAMKNKIVYRQS
ncbi:MAG: DJ-1/PfpI family protein [Lachnospiraceae bacterium]